MADFLTHRLVAELSLVNGEVGDVVSIYAFMFCPMLLSPRTMIWCRAPEASKRSCHGIKKCTHSEMHCQ